MASASNKQIVVDFYDLAFNKKDPEQAVRRYLGPYYKQHNPMAPDGPHAFIEFVKGFVTTFPSLQVLFKRQIAEDDLVDLP